MRRNIRSWNYPGSPRPSVYVSIEKKKKIHRSALLEAKFEEKAPGLPDPVCFMAKNFHEYWLCELEDLTRKKKKYNHCEGKIPLVSKKHVRWRLVIFFSIFAPLAREQLGREKLRGILLRRNDDNLGREQTLLLTNVQLVIATLHSGCRNRCELEKEKKKIRILLYSENWI